MCKRSGDWITPLLVIALSLGFVRASFPQEAAKQPLRLDLRGAVDQALKQNIELQIATIEAATKQQDKQLALAKLLPHIDLETSETVTRFNLKAQIGVDFPGFPHSIGPYQSITTGPTFSTPVFDLTLVRRYQASGHRLLAGKADERSVREETVLLTVSEYMAHLRALANTTAAESRVQLATRLLRQSQDLRDDGVASKIDVSRAEVRLREEQQRLIDAQRDSDTTVFALKRILNLKDETQLEFVDSGDFFSTPPLDITDPAGTAVAKRPELQALAESIKASQSLHQAAVEQVIPKVRLTGHWNEQGQTFNTITPGYEYRFEAKLPLFEGGQIRAERKSTALYEERERRQFQGARNRVVEQTRDGDVELKAALNDAELGKEEVALANEEVSLSEGRFKAGVTDNIEVIAAQDALARANDAEIGALFRYNVARAQLARAVGVIEQIYAK